MNQDNINTTFTECFVVYKVRGHASSTLIPTTTLRGGRSDAALSTVQMRKLSLRRVR